ncbi:MAG: translation termination inhibitor protein itt1 [Peltula sp. TS41687]|nr:MAG: translation termination inhibitor protein itt1 [Peltula sp. TS41687]
MIDDVVDDERETELSSITAIFPEAVIALEDPFSLSIEIPVTSDKPIRIASLPSSDDDGPAGTLPTPPTSEDDGRPALKAPIGNGEAVQDEVCHVTNLPPLSLRVTLPEGYPEKKPPLVDLTTTPSWLDRGKIGHLAGEAVGLWEELGQSPVIFTFIDHLQQAAERVFDLLGDGTDPIRVNAGIQNSLVDFDIKSKREKFERETFECGVCLSPKKGSSCHRMVLCRHVFCVQCLRDFYSSCITEGDVASVKCLQPGCGKDDATAEPVAPHGRGKRRKDRTLDPSELLEIPLDQETVGRYVELKRKNRLESDKNVIYCPRKWCQGPARWKRSRRNDAAASDVEESDDEDGAQRSWKDGDPEYDMPPPSERVAVCEDCSYAFCRVCHAGWHGELTRCWPRKVAELNAEEQATQDYLKEYSSSCPTCNARCQKTMGCNHMVCFKCQSHFCYLCGTRLDERNPYKHFNMPDLACYMRLWVLEGGDGQDAPRAQRARDLMLDNQRDWDSDDDDEDDDDPHEPPPPAPDPPRAGRPVAPVVNMILPPDAPRPGEAVAPVVNMILPPDARRPPPIPVRPADRPNPEGAPVYIPHGHAWRPGRLQGRRQGGGAPGGGGGAGGQFPDRQGLRHFLDLVNNDEEDEWDSDELDEAAGHEVDWEIPIR